MYAVRFLCNVVISSPLAAYENEKFLQGAVNGGGTEQWIEIDRVVMVSY